MASLQQLLSKKSDAGPVTAPRWHPNFRNYERLPDTKVVRTTFFVNTAAVAVAASLLLWAGSRELQIKGLGSQIDESQRQIDAKTRQNTEALRLNQIFADQERKMQEALTFAGLPIAPSDFIIHLGRTLPEDIAIEFMDMRFTQTGGPTIVLRGQAAGPSEMAAGIASGYADVFRADAAFVAAIASADITNVNRDLARGVVTFEIVLKLKTPAKEAKS